MMNKRVNWIVAAVLAIGFAPAWAQAPVNKAAETQAIPGMDHSQMDHGGAPPSKDAAQDKSGGGLDHGSMQGGSPPSDARDPHAYSGGYTFGPDRQLKLADEMNFGSLLVDQLESVRSRTDTATAYELQAWFGQIGRAHV